MSHFLQRLFSTDGFMPHGMCYDWNPGVIWLHVISDGLIALAYYSIPLTLLYFVRKRRDLKFEWIFLCFAVFILACGTTHLMEIINIWHPTYWLSGGIKALTAASSIVTAIMLVRIIPQALSLPSIDAVEKAEEKFRGLVESAPDAIVISDARGEIVLINAQAEALFGYPRKDLVGRRVEALVPERYRGIQPGDREPFADQARARAMGAGVDLFGLRRDGSEFPLEISLSPLETADGRLFTRAIRDVTDRKRIEQALLEKNDQLISAAESKNRFLANMSHELRTPLNGIIGFAEFLSDGRPGPLNAKQKEYLGDILQSGRHLLQLINDVLDLAKVEANKMELHPEKFSLEKAIEGVCAVAKPIAQKKQIAIRMNVAPDLGDVELDLQKFKQVLYNLLSNAIKFTDEEGSVEVQAVAVEQNRFQLNVRDTGLGIRQEDFPRLFTEFEQLESGAGRHYEGTGLGLALTRKIIEMQGGAISVESEVGKGSTFRVVLPKGGRS